uniref:URB1 ribosome biogenesis homolog n=1 Tax=Ovis aries TaxID=9940 RepID=A0AC11DV62_SHEEP
MGVPKRKVSGGRDGAAAPAGAAKRARTEELTGVSFKAQLRDPQGAGPALEAFVTAAKKLPREDVYDVVEGYIKISVECAEIFQLLSGEKRPESEMLLIFQVFEAILLRTASDLSHFHVVGTNIVKKLMNNHMKLICESLYASGYRMARACLNLMAAMVTQGSEAARDVCSHFDLNKKTLYTLVTKRDPKGVHDVRLAYIQFALSFLIAGDDSTITQVLELKEFIPCIFSSGIKEDRISTINILLSTLKTKVVHNKNITKTQKVRFFTGQVLNHIASLYSWKGIVDVSLDSVETSAEDAGKTMVRELVHNFLMDLCCSLKHGINFYDASLGTFGRGGNLTLLHFLLGLKTAADDELVAELVVNILKVCPDLLNKYFKEVTFSFLPRLKSTWSNNIRLLNKIYAAQPDISRAFQTREFIPLPRLLAMVMVTTAPLVCNKIMFTQALNLDSISVKHTALSLVAVILKRALKTIEHCLSKEAWQESGVYTAAMMEDFVRLFREALSKILPDLNAIIWVWQSLRKQDAEQEDEKGKKKASRAAAPCVAPESDDAETILLKAVLLQVICLYQKVVPHVVMQYNFDFSKLLKGVISEEGLREEVPPLLQHHILKVALELPASKFLWLKAQEGPDAEIIGGKRSVFYLLMKMFVTSGHSQLKSSTKLLIVKILRDTGVFEHTWPELELWLEHLDGTAEENKEAVIQFLERVLLTLVANPYSYTDKASDFVQEASALQAPGTRQDADDSSIPISHIDDVLDMVDVLVEGSEGLDEEVGFVLNEDMILLTFPFSAVVPAALEARNKLLLGTESKAGESIVAYLTGVLTDLLHTQRDPLALCLLLQSYDQLEPPSLPCRCLLSWFNKYYSLWIPEPAREALLLQTSGSPALPGPAAPSFSSLLQMAYASQDQGQGPGGLPLLDEGVQAQLRAALLRLPMHQALRAAKHLLLYIRSAVENFPQRPTQPPRKEKPLTALGRTLVQLLSSHAQEKPQSGELLWASEYVRGLAALLPTLAVAELDAVLLGALQREPALVPAVGLTLLDDCLARRTPAALATAALLLRHSWPHRLRFECWCQRAGSGLRLREAPDDFLPVVHVYLQGRTQGRFTRPTGASSTVIPVLRKALWTPLQTRLLSADGPPESGLPQQILAQLVPFARAKDLRALMDHLPSLLQTPASHTSWVVADAVSAILEGSAEELQAWKKTLLKACVQWLIASFSDGQQEDGIQDQEKQMLLRLNELLNSLKEVDPGDWQKFVKTGLKFRYQDRAFLEALRAAMQLLYLSESPACSQLIQLPVVHMMLTQHSLFLPTLLRAAEEEPSDSPVREALVEVMAVVVQLCPSVCASSHFAVLLGAYGASLSILDQKILLLLRAYEQNNHSLVNFRVLLWGPAAVEHQKTCRSLGKSLWQQPSVGDILRLLDRDRMMRTILHFPQNRRLLPPEDAQEPIFRDQSAVDLGDLYDPCFLLHLFSELTRPEFVVDCRKFVDSNALGLTVAALSSYDPHMRTAAYAVLAAYYSQLEGARFREQPQVLYLLDVVRNGIRTKNMRLTFTLALFIAKAALQILKPEERMYMKINRFLLSHEYLNMSKVPGFYQFFYSSDFEQKTEREWVLGLLREGMRDTHCFKLCARRGVLHIVLSFFSSPLCDEAAQNWILEILQNAARDARSAYEMLRDYSLLTWVLNVLESKFLETELLSNLISLLHTLWVTTLGNREVEPGAQPPCKPGSQKPPKLLALHLVDEFLYVLLVLTKHLRPTLASAQLTGFFGALDSVLRYRATVLQAFKDMNRLTVNATVLSTRDVLVLLHKWSLLERDVRLQEDLRAAAEKCQVRELLKMLKEKNKPDSQAKGLRARKRRHGEVEEAADPKLLASTLEACRGLLRSILTHWGPEFPSADPECEDPGPVGVVTSLVAGWVLRSAAGSTLGRADMAGLLGWLQSHVLPRPAVVAELLHDSTVTSGLFRLYSRFCGAAEPEDRLPGLFNAVLLRLVAARGAAGSPLQPVLEAVHLSSLDTEEDADTQAAAAFLVSLYIKDIWLGAQRPDTLLSHVRMVLDAVENSGGGDEEAIVRLCRDIAATVPNT